MTIRSHQSLITFLMASLVAANKSSPSPSCFQKTVTLLDWWLTKPETDHGTKTLGVAGLTSQRNQAARCFSSAPIIKMYNLFELETADGVCVNLQGFINRDRTIENGFPPEVFDHFFIGFPPNWMKFSTNCPKTESAVKCATGANTNHFEEEDGKDSIADFPGKSQSSTVDKGVEDCKDMMLSNKTSTPLNPLSDGIPQEHVTGAGVEVSCESSPGFMDDPSLEMNPIASNPVDSSTRSKCLGNCSTRMTRSMKQMGSNKNNFPLVNDISSNLDKATLTDPGILGSSVNGGCEKETGSCAKEVVLEKKSKRKQIVQHVDPVLTKDMNNADVSGELRIDTSISELKENTTKSKCSETLSNTSVGVIDVNDDDMRTNMKGCRNKKKARVDALQKGVSSTHGISSKEAEAIMTRSKSKTKLPIKRKLIASPKSPKSTTSSGGKGVIVYGTEEKCGSSNIVPLDSFSEKKSRSGRVLLPRLEYWRNQIIVYAEGGQVCGVQDPK